jgi:hypothetical protein
MIVTPPGLAGPAACGLRRQRYFNGQAGPEIFARDRWDPRRGPARFSPRPLRRRGGLADPWVRRSFAALPRLLPQEKPAPARARTFRLRKWFNNIFAGPAGYASASKGAGCMVGASGGGRPRAQVLGRGVSSGAAEVLCGRSRSGATSGGDFRCSRRSFVPPRASDDSVKSVRKG